MRRESLPLPFSSPLALENLMAALQLRLCQQFHHCILTVGAHLWEIFKPCLFGFPLPVWLVSLNNMVTSQQLVF